jgi:hypothetical protein
MITWLTARFNKWFYKHVKNAWDNKHIYETEELSGYMGMNQQKKKSFNILNSNTGAYITSEPSISSLHSETTLTFTLHPATGGYILQFSTYNIAKDERLSKLHIITTDQDLGERIGQIITLECLAR